MALLVSGFMIQFSSESSRSNLHLFSFGTVTGHLCRCHRKSAQVLTTRSMAMLISSNYCSLYLPSLLSEKGGKWFSYKYFLQRAERDKPCFLYPLFPWQVYSSRISFGIQMMGKLIYSWYCFWFEWHPLRCSLMLQLSSSTCRLITTPTPLCFCCSPDNLHHFTACDMITKNNAFMKNIYEH